MTCKINLRSQTLKLKRNSVYIGKNKCNLKWQC